ncbi:hypothetical protein A2763_04555 [Candidatus Kaiserbacteria bacterium RIFCSPHIGHO2_01_FULL_54_36]|uniref:Uncharacterized protein n=1 Tax=Candidatus Kaiserbacteria bacterium RIFCSPHIGHO2_01_FULL_54_36 TaxID=1798482 RepID=A0A1F6CMG9_9BACT|nr:MAG: hypothetical protein A2763_04555 [Candidatus Kaiserbacteria bacterium RIFCSPHIGHO2_01_FULL_54_36]OGG75039.1 MAG: hypothetical protein A3A41_01985 [Candidatus Kaiserbacteria bacterium RIFCSPLOWO2_01_FULL_54_22]
MECTTGQELFAWGILYAALYMVLLAGSFVLADSITDRRRGRFIEKVKRVVDQKISELNEEEKERLFQKLLNERLEKKNA